MADDPIEDLFRQRLQHHEETPPANGWQRIHHTLQQPEKKPFALWRWLSLALLPVATAVLVVKNLPENTISLAPENATEAGTSGQRQSTAQSQEQNTPADNKTDVQSNSEDSNLTANGASDPSNAASAAKTQNTPNPQPNNLSVLPNSATITKDQNASETRLATATGKENQLTVANRPESGVALSPTRTRKAKVKRALAAGTAKKRAEITARQTQLAFAADKQKTSGTASNTKAGDKEDDEAAAPNQGKPATANQSGTSQGLPKNPSGGAPAGSGGSAGAATNATVPKAPATSQPNQPAVASDSLTETQPKDAQRLMAGSILTDSVLAATKVDPKAMVIAAREAGKEEDKKENKTDNRSWHFGGYAGVDYGLRRFAPNTTDQVHIQQLTDKNQFYPERLDYEAGAIAQRKLSDKLALETGLGLRYFREQVEYKAANAPTAAPSLTQYDNTIVLQPVYQYRMVQSNTTAWYTSVRVGAVYSALGSGQTRLQLTGGAMANYRLTEKTTGNAEELNLADPKLTTVQAGAYAGVRLVRQFPGGNSVALEPGFKYFVSPGQKQNTPYSVRSHAATVNLIFFLK